MSFENYDDKYIPRLCVCGFEHMELECRDIRYVACKQMCRSYSIDIFGAGLHFANVCVCHSLYRITCIYNIEQIRQYVHLANKKFINMMIIGNI